MDADFTLPENWEFKQEYALPHAYRGFVLRGAQVITATGEAGSIIIQTFEQPLFTIRFKVIEFFRSVKIPFKHKETSLVSFFALKGDLHYKIKNLGLLKLNAGQFALLHCREQAFVASYARNKIYLTLEINWSRAITEEHRPYFRILEPLFHPIQIPKTMFLGKPALNTDSKLSALTLEILKSPYDEDLSALLFQHKVREYLMLVLLAAGKIPATGLRLSPEEWKKIDAIAALLRNEHEKKFPIVKLASTAQMNPTKLKKGFSEKYGSGVFEFQMECRMNEAMRLLKETNMPLKEIRAEVGYKGLSSFITKFHEYHGITPGKVIRPQH